MNTGKKIKILAVDDNANNLIAMSAIFSGTEYQIIEARSGAEAVELIKIHPDVAVVLLDVQMPEMDGYETATIIKNTPGCQDLPIIFITAYYREDPYVKKGYESGAVDYFGKPFDPELLKMKVNIYSAFRQKEFLLKEREKQIRETEELLRAGKKLTNILEDLMVGVLISDRDGKIIQCNELASRMLNVAGPAGNDHYGEILRWWNASGSVLKKEGGPLELALHEGKSTHNISIHFRSPDGPQKELLASASPLVEHDGGIVGAVVILQDMSQTRRVEQDFEEKVSQLISLSVELEHEKSRYL